MDMYIPDIYQKSIYTIKYDKLVKRGIRCILFDINNTLVSNRSKEIDSKLVELIDKLKKMNIEPIIYTSLNDKRVNYFKENLHIDGYGKVYKHSSKKFGNILSKYKESEIALVGDEMVLDIRHGNDLGITTILVDPLDKDDFISGTKRGKEKRIMTKLRNNNLFVKGRYYE